MDQSPSVLVMIVGFLLVLGPLIILHELGHYLVARWFGVKADAFSVGFGKEIVGFNDRRGTRWKLSAIPMGGYVQFAGDMNATSSPSDEWLSLPEAERQRTFQAKPLWQRALIVAAGPIANFLVAIVILSGFNMAYGKMIAPPVIAGFEQGAPAQKAGLQIGDRIITVNGSAVGDFEDIRDRVMQFPGEEITMVARRGAENVSARFIIGTRHERDRFGNEFRIGRVGIASKQPEAVAVGPIEAVVLGVRQTGDIVSMMVTGVSQIITGRRSVDELGGPLKIGKYAGEQLVSGWAPFASFAALISINLAFINLLPIPALDGGHLAFYAAEAVRRKPVGQRSQEWAFRTGMALVLALMLFVTINDVASLGLFGR